MLTKGYIQAVLSPHSVRVRLPIFNKVENVQGATPVEELATAPICTLPHFIQNPQVGDIVFVDFEEDQYSHPVVLGYLSIENNRPNFVSATLEDLTALGKTRLGTDTNIGEIDYKNIATLKGMEKLITEEFNSVRQDIKRNSGDISLNKTNISTNTQGIENLGLSISALNKLIRGTYSDDEINKHSPIIGDLINLYKKLNKLDDKKLDRSKPILSNETAITYGTTKPSGPGEEGQLYFWIRDEI